MAKFEFKNYWINLEFPGCEFRLNCISDLYPNVLKLHNRYRELYLGYSNGDVTLDDIKAFTSEAIDEFLGAGSADRIFENCEKTLNDLSDVLMFIIHETEKKFIEIRKETESSLVDQIKKQS